MLTRSKAPVVRCNAEFPCRPPSGKIHSDFRHELSTASPKTRSQFLDMFPDAPCMEYLPTFGWFRSEMFVIKYFYNISQYLCVIFGIFSAWWKALSQVITCLWPLCCLWIRWLFRHLTSGEMTIGSHSFTNYSLLTSWFSPSYSHHLKNHFQTWLQNIWSNYDLMMCFTAPLILQIKLPQNIHVRRTFSKSNRQPSNSSRSPVLSSPNLRKFLVGRRFKVSFSGWF